ncbi:DNA-directed RNA polymerases I and III subunit RPAC2 isoform X2 [Anabrus simplex]|uniref:DNA-directed RNA polymerases I and III subunit RPAC2 isoform X2 n=1 Tax=Anabrus simplex TaxID=316456 RepID=UPI0035A3428A
MYALFLAGDEKSDGKSRTFVFQDEGHTLGNALRCIIVRYPEVVFCGYTIPHPADSRLHFRIQTIGPPAVDILRRGLADLEKLCDHTLKVFQNEMEGITSA